MNDLWSKLAEWVYGKDFTKAQRADVKQRFYMFLYMPDLHINSAEELYNYLKKAGLLPHKD